MSDRIDHHHFFHFDSDDRNAVSVHGILANILTRLRALEAQERSFMKTESDLQAGLDAIQKEVGDVATRQAAMAKTIADLQAAGPATVTQSQLDSLAAEADAIAQQLAPLAAPPAPA